MSPIAEPTKMQVVKKATKEQIGRFYKLTDALLTQVMFMSGVPVQGTIMFPSGNARTENKTGFYQVIQGVLEVGMTEDVEDGVIFHKIFELTVPEDSMDENWTGIVVPKSQTVNKFALRTGKDLILVRMPYTFIETLNKNERFKQSFFEVQQRTLLQLMNSFAPRAKSIPHSQIHLLAVAFISLMKEMQVRGTAKDVELLIGQISEMIGKVYSDKVNKPDAFGKSDGLQEIFNILVKKGYEDLK